jgi:hypothetical protein
MIGVTFSQIHYEEYEKTQDKDIFEVVIDSIMIERYSKDEDLTTYLKSLDYSQKRIAILLLLNEDNYEWETLTEKIKGNKVDKVKHLKEIIEDIRHFSKYGQTNKKLLGEVMTPIEELAKPMVKLVEKYDDSFWKNPNNKVLDGSAGVGTFLILSCIKFMIGLKEWEPNVEKRYKHIVENCLYYGDIRDRNVFLWLCIIDPYNEYKTNTYWGSFLDEEFNRHMKYVWGIEKFDLSIQNPPYQVQKEGFKKTQPIWHEFVEKTLDLVKDDGYIIMVHPGGWRNVDGVFKKTQVKLRKNQILELNIFNEKKGLEFFGAETRFDYYISRKSNKDVETVIKTQDGSIFKTNIKNMEFIPNGDFNKINKLIAKGEEERVEILYSRSMYGTDKNNVSDEFGNGFIYPCVYTVPKGDTLKLKYSSEKKGHFGLPKLIWSNGRIISVGSYIDENGEYGLTQFSYGITDKSVNLKNIKKAFDSKEFRNLMEMCAVGQMVINRKIIATFRKDFWKEFI